ELVGGYAAYAVGLLRCREAAPELRKLAASSNVFVRYSAGRALIECGDPEGAAPILKKIMSSPVPPDAPFDQVEDPYYQALAARAYMELGGARREEGLDRLIGLMKELEHWQEINARGRLETTRRVLALLSGKYFLSHEEARAWREEQARKGAPKAPPG